MSKHTSTPKPAASKLLTLDFSVDKRGKGQGKVIQQQPAPKVDK